MKAKTWWKNNADAWLNKMDKWPTSGKGNTRNFEREADFLFYTIVGSGKLSALEVGAGDGRIIGQVSNVLDSSSIDINPELSEYVKKKYPLVKTYVGEIIDLPFKDKEFDLVFTHEVLQHIEPSEIEKACSELTRVGKEVWCMESWRSTKNGEKVSDSHCGRWNWDLKKYFNCYYDYYTDWGQLFIKSKE